MTLFELQQILARGEDSQYHFKQNITNADSIAAELLAMVREKSLSGSIIMEK